MIELSSLKKTYMDGEQVINAVFNVNMTVEQGDFGIAGGTGQRFAAEVAKGFDHRVGNGHRAIWTYNNSAPLESV